MDELGVIGLVLGIFFGSLITMMVVGDKRQEEYRRTFTAECKAKGGVPQFNRHSTDLCLPAGSVIPMENAR